MNGSDIAEGPVDGPGMTIGTGLGVGGSIQLTEKRRGERRRKEKRDGEENGREKKRREERKREERRGEEGG